jgi:hypothetical protein
MVQQECLFDQNGRFWVRQFLQNEGAFLFNTINKLALPYTTPLIPPHTPPPIPQLAHPFQYLLLEIRAGEGRGGCYGTTGIFI